MIHYIPERTLTYYTFQEKREEEDLPALIKWLKEYIEKHEEGLIRAITNDSDNKIDNLITIPKKQNLKKTIEHEGYYTNFVCWFWYSN